MRRVRRVRPSPLRVPVVAEDDYREQATRSAYSEIAVLNQVERDDLIASDINDFVSNRIVSVDNFTNPLKMGLYDLAIKQFRERMPPDMIRRYVDAAIRREVYYRAELQKRKRSLARKSQVSSTA